MTGGFGPGQGLSDAVAALFGGVVRPMAAMGTAPTVPPPQPAPVSTGQATPPPAAPDLASLFASMGGGQAAPAEGPANPAPAVKPGAANAPGPQSEFVNSFTHPAANYGQYSNVSTSGVGPSGTSWNNMGMNPGASSGSGTFVSAANWKPPDPASQGVR